SVPTRPPPPLRSPRASRTAASDVGTTYSSLLSMELSSRDDGRSSASPFGMGRQRRVKAVPLSSSRPRRFCPSAAGLYQIAAVSVIDATVAPAVSDARSPKRNESSLPARSVPAYAAQARPAHTPAARRPSLSAMVTLTRRLFRLPPVERAPRAVLRGIHRVVVVLAPGGELDHVPVRIAEVDRLDELVVGEAARVDAGPLALVVHPAQVGRAHLDGDVEVVVVLLLELERHVGRLEEREARPVVHGVERVERVRGAAALGLG